MLTHQSNEVSISQDDDNVPLSRLRDLKLNTKEKEKKQRKREKMPLKKKAKLDWKPEDAHTYGRWTKFSGEGVNKKFHYETFEFHSVEYRLEDTVQLAPEKKNQRPYIAIIKDIYRKAKKENVKLEVEWFYRPEDIENGNWESKDDLFYSFHRDEVDAEAVMQKCLVYFVQGNKELPNCRPSPDFNVRKFYDHEKKKLKKFSHRGFNVQQKNAINLLVAKTISRVRDLPDFEIGGASRTISSDIDREKILEELLEVVKHMYRTSEEKQAGDCDFVSPNDVVPVVRALEHALYDSLVEDIPKYNYKVKILVDKLKNSQVFCRRLFTGEIKPEQAIKMTRYELMRGFTFDEIKASFEE